MLSIHGNDFIACWEYAEWISSHAEHTQKRFHRTLSILGNDFIASWAYGTNIMLKLPRKEDVIKGTETEDWEKRTGDKEQRRKIGCGVAMWLVQRAGLLYGSPGFESRPASLPWFNPGKSRGRFFPAQQQRVSPSPRIKIVSIL
jgi:hypothetical protein